MRLIKKETRRKAVLLAGLGGALLLTAVFALFLTVSAVKSRYESELEAGAVRISLLEAQIRSNTMSVYKAVTDIKAGERVTSDKVEEAEVTSSMEKGLYMTQAELGRVSRIDIEKGTYLISSMLHREGEHTAKLSEVGYSSVKIPGNIEAGDFVDVRIYYPNGEDLVVLAEKQITELQNASTFYLKLSEAELLMMASAVTDIEVLGAKLYLVKCCSIGEEQRSKVNYLPSEQVLRLIVSDAEEKTEKGTEEIIEEREELEKRVQGGM